MADNTLKFVDSNRVARLLECYGADPQCWPDEERAAALKLISASSELQALQQEAAQLDGAMDVHNIKQRLNDSSDTDAVMQILQQLPPQDSGVTPTPISNAKRSTAPLSKRWISLAMAASVAVVALVSLIMVNSPDSPTSPKATQTMAAADDAELDQWMWQQVTGLPASEENDDPLTFMAFVELEAYPIDE
jgi:hypothetical protein